MTGFPFGRKKKKPALWVFWCSRQHRITPVLYSLHWLPVSCRIQHKVSSLCHCSLSEAGLRYLLELLHKYTPFRQLHSSSDSFMLHVPTTNRKTLGEKSFSFTGPTVWNSLPFDICSINSTPSFKQALKTHLFNSYFISYWIQPLLCSHSHHQALYTLSSFVIQLYMFPPQSALRPPLWGKAA